ncbi:MAG TPA: transporter substrate-binding domain-containing protein [Azospirillum sp.]|nr:transporter substrate-binding domain-containing protein [Azospirillum sp.]
MTIMPHRAPRFAALALAALLALASMLVSPRAQAADTFIVAVNDNDRPFGYVDERGELAGFNVDIARALCRALAAECRLVPTRFPDFVPGVADGRFDFAVANLLRTPERERVVDFTSRLWRSSSSFMGRPGAVRDLKPASLAGKTIGVQKGGVQERWLTETLGPQVRIEGYDSIADRNAALLAGTVDLALGSTVGNFVFLNSPDGAWFEIIGDPMFDQGLGGDVAIPVAKGREALRQRLNAALAAILSDGTFSQINVKYFPISVY